MNTEPCVTGRSCLPELHADDTLVLPNAWDAASAAAIAPEHLTFHRSRSDAGNGKAKRSCGSVDARRRAPRTCGIGCGRGIYDAVPWP